MTDLAKRRLRRPIAVAALTCVLVAPLLPGCASVHERRGLRVEPLEKPRPRLDTVGQGYQLRARRMGDAVLVEVAAASYCQQVLQQKARGFRVTERQVAGPSLVAEWVFGGLFVAAGSGIIAWNVTHPAEPAAEGEFAPDNATKANIYGGVIGAAGLALLVGAAVQQASLGVHETELGVQTLEKRGRVFPCKLSKATGGKLRLTLADGLQIVADVQPDGRATLPLPPDLDTRLEGEGRRATLEALGDWRSQTRIDL